VARRRSRKEVNQVETKTVLLSKTQFGEEGGETVFATISNDWAKDADGSPIPGNEFSYQMSGFQLHGPIPKDSRGGFSSWEEAEAAARREYKDWREGKVPKDVKVTRQEYWEMHYRMDRYLRHLTDEELGIRLDEVINNGMGLTADQKIDFTDAANDQLAASFTHVLEEYRLRSSGIPEEQIKKLHFPNYEWPGIKAAFDAFDSLKIEPGSYLLKYSKKEHLIDTIEKGVIRISPASTLDDPSLNYAIRDDELSFSLQSLEARKERRSELLTIPTDYYVYCMANEFSLRLFGDFQADACLVITKPFVFLNRLGNAVLKQLPGWIGFGRPVTYLDPVKAKTADIDIFITKSFRFEYQREYRLFWRPQKPQKNLPYLWVEIGSLHDCSKLIDLGEKGPSTITTDVEPNEDAPLLNS